MKSTPRYSKESRRSVSLAHGSSRTRYGNKAETDRRRIRSTGGIRFRHRFFSAASKSVVSTA